MSLYREAQAGDDYGNPQLEQGMDVVPVEPCVHGNYARHIDPESLTVFKWCDGNPVGEKTSA
jgi:hypothetical protein